MRTWSAHCLDRLVKTVSSSSGITCSVPISDSFKSSTAGIRVTSNSSVFLVTRVTSGIKEQWIFQSVLMTSGLVLHLLIAYLNPVCILQKSELRDLWLLAPYTSLAHD